MASSLAIVRGSQGGSHTSSTLASSSPGKQLITSYEAENSQIFVDEERLSHLGLTLQDLARFLESQPFVFAAFTQDEVRRAAGALK